MLVVDLHCESGHLFEGWFASADDLSSQQARGLVSCPVCGSHEVTRRPSASRLNVSSLKSAKLEGTTKPSSSPRDEAQAASRGAVVEADGAPAKASGTMSEADVHALQAMYLKAVQHVMANTEDVGDRFVDEVRSMHHGDAPERAVRGQASDEERAELLEEGIEILSLPVPQVHKGTLQ